MHAIRTDMPDTPASVDTETQIVPLEYIERRIAFTELGVAMLSSVLNTERAVQINILIMRAFVRLRTLLSTHKEPARHLDEIEARFSNQLTGHDQKRSERALAGHGYPCSA